MPRVKQWVGEDRERALQWVERKAKTGTVFRGQSGSVESEMAALVAIVEPEAVAERLRESLTDEAWKRLLSALRQRKHASKADTEAGTSEPAAAAECRQCAELRAEIERLHADIASAVKAGEQWAAMLKDERNNAEMLQDRVNWLEEILSEHGLLDEEGDPIEDSVRVTQSESVADAEVGALAVEPLPGNADGVADAGGDLTAAEAAALPKIRALHAQGKNLRQIAGALRDEQQKRGEEPSWSAARVERLFQKADVTQLDAFERAAVLRAAGQSYRAIAAALNAEGFPTRSGRGQWQPGSVQAMLRDA